MGAPLQKQSSDLREGTETECPSQQAALSKTRKKLPARREPRFPGSLQLSQPASPLTFSGKKRSGTWLQGACQLLCDQVADTQIMEQNMTAGSAPFQAVFSK
uniref:Uncharacterized protein n=1 Tax=Micrurus surinamensis TaxID=129470 RepID=A0A2D4P309_MICSU